MPSFASLTDSVCKRTHRSLSWRRCWWGDLWASHLLHSPVRVQGCLAAPLSTLCRSGIVCRSIWWISFRSGAACQTVFDFFVSVRSWALCRYLGNVWTRNALKCPHRFEVARRFTHQTLQWILVSNSQKTWTRTHQWKGLRWIRDTCPWAGGHFCPWALSSSTVHEAWRRSWKFSPCPHHERVSPMREPCHR